MDLPKRLKEKKQKIESGRPTPFATSRIIGPKNKRTNNKAMRLDTNNNGAAGYQVSVIKKEQVPEYRSTE